MQNVKVRRTGISADDAAQVLRDGLGDGYEIQADGAAIGEAAAFRDDD